MRRATAVASLPTHNYCTKWIKWTNLMRQNQQEQSCKTASILGKQSYLRNAEDILVYMNSDPSVALIRRKKMVAEKIQNENGG